MKSKIYKFDPVIQSDGYFNWLLAHHFDFMGLIPKGLAIKATEDNNPYTD